MDYKRILWTSLLILAAGIVLLCYKQPSLDLCVRFLGAVLTASSVLNIAMQFAYQRQSKADGSKHSMASIGGMMTAIASGALGLWMLLAPSTFTTAMVYIFGALMIIGGLSLLYMMVYSYKPVKFPAGVYILPSLVAICGIVMCVISPETTKNVIITITAISMIVFSVGAIIMISGVASYSRSIKHEEKEQTTDEHTEPANPSIVEQISAPEQTATPDSEKTE